MILNTLSTPEILINLGVDVNKHTQDCDGKNYTPLHEAVVAVIDNGHREQGTFPIANYIETCALLSKRVQTSIRWYLVNICMNICILYIHIYIHLYGCVCIHTYI